MRHPAPSFSAACSPLDYSSPQEYRYPREYPGTLAFWAQTPGSRERHPQASPERAGSWEGAPFSQHRPLRQVLDEAFERSHASPLEWLGSLFGRLRR